MVCAVCVEHTVSFSRGAPLLGLLVLVLLPLVPLRALVLGDSGLVHCVGFCQRLLAVLLQRSAVGRIFSLGPRTMKTYELVFEQPRHDVG
jgi:hypothetical protein